MIVARDLVEQRYLPIPTNTQMTERGVKEGALCATSSRGEISRSIYAVARSGVCEKAGNLAEGEKSERDKEIKRDDRRRGTLKSEANIEMTMNQYAIIKQFRENNPEEYKAVERRARTYLATRDSHFSSNRINEKVEAFQKNMSHERALNRFERLTGYGRTEVSQGKVRLTTLVKAKHERAVELELMARGVDFDPKELWTKKKERLKEHENNQEDDRYFIPLTSAEAFAAT